MTRAYPEDYENRKELLLLQNMASYMLLACGGVYIISVCYYFKINLEVSFSFFVRFVCFHADLDMS